MFIRKTAKTDLKSGKTYSAYYLVESSRTAKGPRQKVLLYMGSSIDLPEVEHRLLAQRIGEIVVGQIPLVPYSEPIERLARMYASQVIQRLSEAINGVVEPLFDVEVIFEKNLGFGSHKNPPLRDYLSPCQRQTDIPPAPQHWHH